MRAYAEQAGVVSCDVADVEDAFFRFYVLRTIRPGVDLEPQSGRPSAPAPYASGSVSSRGPDRAASIACHSSR